MKKPGQVILFEFPQTNLKQGNLRPALLVSKLPGQYDDWLMCMISTQTQHYIKDFDELIQFDDPDYKLSGLKDPSIIRVERLAVVNADILLGAIGEISAERLRRVKTHLSEWIMQ
ncbi:type II toxin-antitoxin system PemK/MazF family toxin [bacterium]|nr:type II toxin-antitoxin system PemK/MazF family toxin [bacterium]